MLAFPKVSGLQFFNDPDLFWVLIESENCDDDPLLFRVSVEPLEARTCILRVLDSGRVLRSHNRCPLCADKRGDSLCIQAERWSVAY
jgi:hypothetical protein